LTLGHGNLVVPPLAGTPPAWPGRRRRFWRHSQILDHARVRPATKLRPLRAGAGVNGSRIDGLARAADDRPAPPAPRSRRPSSPRLA